MLGDSQPYCESQICICINKLKLTLGQHADLQRQCIFDSHILVLCRIVALNAWDRTEEAEKRIELFTKMVQKKPSLIFLQRLTSALNRIISYPEIRQILIESLFCGILV